LNLMASSENQPPPPTFLDDLWDEKTARILSTILIFVAVLAFLRGARDTLTLFLFAILFAYFLAPLVSMLEKPLKGRGNAIIVVYLGLLAVLVAVGVIAGPKIGEEARAFGSSLPSLSGNLASGQIVSALGQHFHWGEGLIQQVQLFLSSHRDDILEYGKQLGARLAKPAQKLWWLILIPILSVFFLRQGQAIAAGAVELGRSTEERKTIEGLLHDVNVMLGTYIRSQMILASLTLLAYTVVLSLLRVPYSFVLGPVAGFLEFIPVVGPALAAVSVVVISVLGGYPHAVWLIVFLGVWRLLQDYVTAPRVMGESLEINPLMQIFAVLAGAEIAGVVGALVSVPLVAALRIIWRRISTPRPQSSTVAT
jgi:predicted PurR-regulated permease PerM